MENKVIAKEYVDKNFIHKDVIREIFKRIDKCKIRTDGRISIFDYMIIGETSRATGKFINLDFIEKVILNEDGYSLKLLEDK